MVLLLLIVLFLKVIIMRFLTSLLQIVALSFFFFSCKPKRKEIPLFLNVSVRDSLLKKHGNNIAILSCLRCDCFVRYFNDYNNPTNKYVLLTDTNCNKLKVSLQYISNAEVERLSDGIYNLTLIKLNKGKVETKILDAKDNRKIAEDINSFYQ